MSSSKFADLEDVDFGAPDVYETSPGSPRRRAGRRGDYSDSSDSDDSDSSQYGGGTERGADRERRDRNGGGRNGGAKKGVEVEGSPDIEKVHIDADKAMDKFRKATGLDGRDADFSPAIHRRRKKEQYYPPPSKAMEATRYELGYGFRATSGEDEAERGEEGFQEVKKTTKESTLHRLRRLRIEMDEVESELQESAIGSKSESVGSDQGQAHKKDGENERASLSLLVQLKSLRGQLGQLDERASQAADVGLDAAASQRWEREARKLLESLSSIERREDLSKSSHANVDDGDSQPIKLDSEGVKMASLDRRLAGLEDLVGIRDAAQDDAKSLVRPLLPSVARIEHLLTLLTHPRHLDGISRRVKVLVSELERVHEARRKIDTSSASNRLGIPSANGLEGGSSPLLGGTSPGVGTSSPNGLTTETLTKLEANFALLSRLEPLMPLAPTLLSRLHSLSSLHASAAGFSDDVNSLLVAAKTSEATHEELQTVLANVESSLRENQQRVQANLESVEARIEGLAKRVEKLS